MGHIKDLFRAMPDELRAYSAEIEDERWKKDFDEVERLIAFQRHLAHGLAAYAQVDIIREAWLRAMESGEFEFREEDAKAVLSMFSEWLKPCQTAERIIQRFEAIGHEVVGAKAFRDHCILARSHVDDEDIRDLIAAHRAKDEGPSVPVDLADL